MMDLSAKTPLDSPTDLLERKRLLDDTWLLTLFVIFLATALPWFLRIVELDFAPVAWSLFAYGAAYLALGFATDRMRSHGSLPIVLGTLQAAGVVFLGFIWHQAGGLQNPMFLLAFALPVVGGGLISRWQPYVSALLGTAVVTIIGFIEAPELRWYALQLGLPVTWLADFTAQTLPNEQRAFPGFYAPPSYYCVLLVLFAMLLFGIALMSESLTSFLFRLHARLGLSARALDEAQALSTQVLRVAPVPTALVFADTFNIVHASQSFISHLQVSRKALRSGNLFDVVNFSYPEAVEGLINGGGGEVPFCVYRVGNETRIARVRAYSLMHEGIRCAYLSVEDFSETYYLRAALDAADYALLVIGAGDRILCFNKIAQGLFGEVAYGMEASRLLIRDGLLDGWWRPGPRGRHKHQLELSRRSYQATSVAVPLAGEEEQLIILALRPSKGDE